MLFRSNGIVKRDIFARYNFECEEPIRFYNGSGLVENICLGNENTGLKITDDSVRSLLLRKKRKEKNPIMYQATNLRHDKQGIILLGLFDHWVNYSDTLKIAK